MATTPEVYNFYCRTGSCRVGNRHVVKGMTVTLRYDDPELPLWQKRATDDPKDSSKRFFVSTVGLVDATQAKVDEIEKIKAEAVAEYIREQEAKAKAEVEAKAEPDKAPTKRAKKE